MRFPPRFGLLAAISVAASLSAVAAGAEEAGPSGAASPPEVVPLALLLPRRAADGSLQGVATSRPVVHGGRLLGIVTTPPDPSGGRRDDLLFCIDLSDAAEGRIEWTAPLPPAMARFEGSPWVEGERVRAVAIREGPRASRMIASFDLFNGRHLDTVADDRSEGAGVDTR